MSEDRGKLILIVDDTPTNISVLTEALRDDYELGVATSGVEAIEYIKEHTPDLVLMDIVMPEMNGYEVCACLKQDGRLDDVPVIFISALDEIESKTKCFELGAVDYITKPFEVVEVKARVRMHLEKKIIREALRAQNEKLDKLSKKLSKYLSPQIYNSIFSGEKDVKLETHRKKLTVFFSDIQAFTEMTDYLEAETLTYVLNEYLNEMSQVALKHGGTLDKFIGDAILIFFGDPETRGVKEDAQACLHMALEMRARIRELRRSWDKEGVTRPLHVRMGIATGFCTVGNFGSEDRLEYTIIGNQVNLANRLQFLAKEDQILIAEETHALVKDMVICQKRDEIKLKGLGHPVQTYEVLDFEECYRDGRSRFGDDMEEFLSSYDLESLTKEERKKAIQALKTAVDRLEPGSTKDRQ